VQALIPDEDTMPPLPRPAPGFTLLEVAIVCCIAAVLITLAWPGIASLIENRRLEGVASALGGDLQFARSEAIVRNEPVRFTVPSGAVGDACWLVHTGPASDCSCASGCTGEASLLRKNMVPAAAQVRLEAPATSLHFDPQLGTCTPTGTFKLLAKSGNAVHQIVNLMGRVRTCSPRAQGGGHAAC